PTRRLAVWYSDPGCPVDTQIVAAMRSAVQALPEAGFDVAEDHPAIDLSAAHEAFRRLLVCVNGGDYTPQDLAEIAAGRPPAGPELGADFVAQRYHEWKAANETRHQQRAVWAEFFTRYDAILLPVAPNRAGRHD